MNSKVTAVVSYFTWIGFIIAIIIGEKDDFSKHHMNQAFLLWLLGTIGAACMKLLGVIPVIGKLCGIVFGIFDGILGIMAIVGIVCAIVGSKYELPVVGQIHILN